MSAAVPPPPRAAHAPPTGGPPGISVVVIAHDEERHIRECLASVLAQTIAASEYEIILVAHNCRDRTAAIAREFGEVRVVPLDAPAGPVYARIEGFAQASGAIVACIDGDCVAEPHWLADLVAPLRDPAISAVGGVTIFHGNWFVWLGSYVVFYVANRWPGRLFARFVPKLRYPVFWGTSFACRRADYRRVGGLEPALDLHRRFALAECAEDFYLSLKFWQIGAIAFTRWPVAHATSKQRSAVASIVRVWRQQRGERCLLQAVMRPRCVRRP